MLGIQRRKPDRTGARRRLLGRLGGRNLDLIGYLVGLLLLANFVILRLADPAPVATLRNQTFDLYQRLTLTSPARPMVTIVDIDEASLAELGQWPWPRTVLARLVERLTAAGAVVIGFDVIFAEPDRVSPPNIADTIETLDEETRQRLSGLPDNDALFAQAIARSRVVLAQAGASAAAGSGSGPPPRKVSIAQLGGDPRPFVPSHPATVRNIPVLEEAAGGIGSIGLSPESDGITRRVPLIVNLQGRLVPTLSVEMLRLATGQKTVGVRTDEARVAQVLMPGLALPTGPDGRAWVRFWSLGSIPYVSVSDVLAPDFDPSRVRGRLVLVGTSATGLLDVKTTPVAPFMPGVEVHASYLQSVLDQKVLNRPNYMIGAEVTAMAVISLVIVVLTPFLSAVATLAFGGVLMALVGAASWYLFTEHALLLDVTATGLAGLVIYGTLTYLKYMREERERKQVRSTFAQYLSPEVVEQLAAHPEQLRLGGETREMTVLFADIRGFTAISEHVTAEELTALINRILTPLTEAVLAHKGTVDKYIGDCIMAFWNAPLDDPEHARNGCLTGLALVDGMIALNEELRAEAREAGRDPPPEIRVGVGLNTGPCCVGNIGSDYRFSYSALGDTVNLASRLEGQSRYYGCPVIVGEETARQAADLAILPVDRVRVVGRAEAADIHAVLGDAERAATPEFRDLAAAHGRMLAAYFAADWDAAAAALADARTAAEGVAPLEPLYALFADRIADNRARGVEPGWDGVFEAVKK